MPSRLKRYHTFGHDHFVTFSYYHRLPYLDNDYAKTVFLETVEKLRQRHGYEVFGYVLMPEHVHLLMGEPKHTRLDAVFRALKTQTSKRLKGDRERFCSSVTTTSTSSHKPSSPRSFATCTATR